MAEKILLVDDDKELREELRESFSEYDVTEAVNGRQALEILAKPNEIDLVLLDVMMPDINGIDVLKEIRQKYPELGIIILTGFSSVNIAIDALRNHADDFIEKPLDIEKTKDVINAILDKKARKEGTPLPGIQGKVERVKKFAERNCHKKTCLKDAAASIYLSPKYLSRLFKQNTGKRFSEYKLDLKIEDAKHLLTETDLNVNQISEKMGYQNTESFIRIFKKFTNLTPTKYRKQQLENISKKKESAKEEELTKVK